MRQLLLIGAALVGSPVLAEECGIGRMAELPVTMRGMQPTIPVRINGQAVTFVADSGAFFSTITPAWARQLDLHVNPMPDGFYVSGIGGDAKVTVAKIKNLGLAGSELQGIDFLVGGSEIEGYAGLIGQNVLQLADAEYDLAGGAIRLMRPHGCGNRNLAYWAAGRPVQIVPIESIDANRHIVGTVEVNGIKLRALFDTGAYTSMLTKAAAAKVGVRPGGAGVERNGYSSGIGRKLVASWIAPFDSFRIDGEEIRKTRIRISDVSDADYDMLVGADFFLAHRIYVANSQHRMFLTYNGGPVFQLDARPTAMPPIAEGVPDDADGFARRAAARLSRRDLDGAIVDFDKAVALAPKEPQYLVQRAEAWLGAKQPARARADLDAALRLDARNIDALLARAEMHLSGHDRDAARADLIEAGRIAAPQADQRLRIAGMLEAARASGEAIGEYTMWIDAHPVDSKRAAALNGRCWSRALAGRELAQALQDCTAALRLRPKTPDFMDSRGLVRLRLGDTAGAILDYDAVLATEPKARWSLFGRGLALIRSGREAEGRKDIADALAVAPKLTEDARTYGIIPADGEPR